MANGRETVFTVAELQRIFNGVGGYYDMPNTALADAIIKWNFLDENNLVNTRNIDSFMKWSFTASLLQLVNAFQWFFAGVILTASAPLTAQALQMYYYSIFFSMGAFLSAQFKGHYTLSETYDKQGTPHGKRNEVWVNKSEKPMRIQTQEQGSAGEHKIRANWFYEVFNGWELKDLHGGVKLFQSNQQYHSGYRNMFTYSLRNMGEELFSMPDHAKGKIPNDILIQLWNLDDDIAEYYPEQSWALEHIKVPLFLHLKLLEGYEDDSPYYSSQINLFRQLYNHHKTTDLSFFLEGTVGPILEHMDIMPA